MEVGDWLKENSIIASIIIILFLAITGITLFLVISNNKHQTDPKTISKISFRDGANEITINRNTGEVTIKTPKGTFTQYWDKDKIENFFAGLDDLDFDSLAQYIGTDLAIELTLSSGEVLVLSVENLDQDQLDEIEKIIEITYQQNNSTPKPVINNPDNFDFSQDEDEILTTPINNNPWKTGGEIDSQSTKCEQYDPETGKRVVVSNTICGQ